jgi:hypothetical protein
MLFGRKYRRMAGPSRKWGILESAIFASIPTRHPYFPGLRQDGDSPGEDPMIQPSDASDGE